MDLVGIHYAYESLLKRNRIVEMRKDSPRIIQSKLPAQARVTPPQVTQDHIQSGFEYVQ